jgi:formamidopyrimidine-DNA glycosylase
VPELPEVEALTVFLGERLAGRVIEELTVVAISALKTFSPPPSELGGRCVTSVSRHGKFLDIEASGLHLVFHLARAGWVRWHDPAPNGRPRPGRGPLALRLLLSGPTALDLTEAGTQKRLAAYVVADPAHVPGVARLGTDPLDPRFTVEVLASLLAGRRAQIKGTLTDQTVLAGVGNAYSDEALHQACISPFRTAASLTEEETERLYRALTGCLRHAVERSAGLPASGLKDDKRAGLQVHGRTGLPCPVCGDTIRQVAFADRSLQYCPTCQTGGKPLADRRLSRLLK